MSTLQDVITECRKLEQHDPVTRPIHYTEGAIECIDAIEAAIGELSGVDAYLTGQTMKYLWRWGRKDGKQDLRKALWYLNRLIARQEAATHAH